MAEPAIIQQPASVSPMVVSPLVMPPPAPVVDPVQAATQELTTDPARSALLTYCKRCFTESYNAKNSYGIIENMSITTMLLECQARRDSVHTNKKIVDAIAKGYLPNHFEPITAQKVCDALAWDHDAMMSLGPELFTSKPSEIPDIPEERVAEIRASVQEEAMREAVVEMENGAEPLDADKIQEIADEIVEKERKKVQKIAQERCDRMASLIKDQLQDIGFDNLRDEFKNMAFTFGTAFYWGPYAKTVKEPRWENGQRVIQKKVVPCVDVVNPQDIFQAPWMTSVRDHGYVIRRQKVVADELRAFKGVPGWFSEEIDALISETCGQSRDFLPGDDQRARQEGKTLYPDKRDDFMWFVGHVPGSYLKSFDVKFAEETREYHVNVMWMGNRLLCVRPNWWDLEYPPLHHGRYEEKPGSFYGMGIAMKMRHAQDEAHAVALPKLDHLGWALAGITTYDLARIINKEQVKTPVPRVPVLADTREGMNTTLPVVTHQNVDLHINEMDQALERVYSKADEQSGIRKYTLGSDKVSGAGRTVGGLAMLTEGSNKTLRNAMFHCEKADLSLFEAMADWNNRFGPENIRGDIKIVMNGASGFFMQEMQVQQIDKMIDRLLNPTLAQVPGVIEQAVDLIRQQCLKMKIDAKHLADIEDKIEAARAAAMEKAQQTMTGNQGGANTAGTPPNPDNE